MHINHSNSARFLFSQFIFLSLGSLGSYLILYLSDDLGSVEDLCVVGGNVGYSALSDRDYQGLTNAEIACL